MHQRCVAVDAGRVTSMALANWYAIDMGCMRQTGSHSQYHINALHEKVTIEILESTWNAFNGILYTSFSLFSLTDRAFRIHTLKGSEQKPLCYSLEHSIKCRAHWVLIWEPGYSYCWMAWAISCHQTDMDGQTTYRPFLTYVYAALDTLLVFKLAHTSTDAAPGISYWSSMSSIFKWHIHILYQVLYDICFQLGKY